MEKYMYSGTRPINDDDDATCEEEMCEERKENIDNFIAESVSKCKRLRWTIGGVQKLNESPLDCSERLYVERTYVDCCIHEFLAEVDAYLRDNIKQVCKDLVSFTSYLKGLREIRDVEKYFSHLRHSERLRTCKVDKVQTEDFLPRLRRICWKHVIDEVKSMKAEKEFVDALESYLKQCFLKSSPIFQGRLDSDHSIATIVSYLRDNNDQDCTALKAIIEKANYFTTYSSILEHSVKTVVDDFLSPPTTKSIDYKGGKAIECSGRYLDLAKIAHEISKFHLDYAEVHIFAHQLLRVNSNLTLPGLNVAVVTPEIHVCDDNIVWDLSGKDAVNSFITSKAADGVEDGEDGEAGLHGSAGQSGGNVYIQAEMIHHGENLLIRSNGGHGSDGQHGGNGKKGKAGVDGFQLTEAEFKERFPDCIFRGVTNCRYKWVNIASIKSNHGEFSDIDGEMYTGNTAEGNKVQLSIYDDSMRSALPRRRARRYCLVKGTDGTMGQKGGDGGCGGDAGDGGFAGNVVVRSPHTKEPLRVHLEYIDGKNGKKGEDGRGGEGGRNGRKGSDWGQLEIGLLIQPTKILSGNLYLSYSPSQNSRNVWCPKERKYAEIREAPIPPITNAESGAVGIKKRKTTQRRQTRLRQTPISVEDVVQQFETSRRSRSDSNENITEYLNQGLTELESISDLKHDNKCLKRVFGQSPVSEIVTSTSQANYIPLKMETKIKRKDKIDMVGFIQGWERDARAANTKNEQKALIKQNIQHLPSIFETIKTDFLGTADINRLLAITTLIHDNLSTKELIGNIQEVLSRKYRFALLHDIRAFTENIVRKIGSNAGIQTNIQLAICDFYNEYLTEILAIHHKTELDEFNSTKEVEIEEIIRLIVDLQDQPKENNKMAIFGSMDTYPHVTEEVGDCKNDEKEKDGEIRGTVLTAREAGSIHALPLANNAVEEDRKHANEEPLQRGFGNELKSLVSGLPEDIRRLILKLQYLDSENATLLATVLSERIAVEGLHIPNVIFKWLITCIIEECEVCGLSECIIEECEVCGLSDYFMIFGTTTSNMWLLEYLMRQLREKNCLSYTEQIEFREKILSFNNHEILLFLSQRLTIEGTEIPLTTDTVIKILDLSKDINIDDELCSNLQTFRISDWPYRLEQFQIMLKLKYLPTDPPIWQNDALIEASHYMSRLSNINGHIITDKLMEAIRPREGQKVIIRELLQMLHYFNSNYWVLNERAISAIKEQPSTKWVDQLNKELRPEEIRYIQELTELMVSDSNNSIKKSNLDGIKNIVFSAGQVRTVIRPIKDWTDGDIRYWAQRVRDASKNEPIEFMNKESNLAEVIAVVDRAIMITKGFALRDTQKLSIAMFLRNGGGMLQQLSTGEGKTLIIAALSIIKALCGENVDVITSSSVLAERDALENHDLYELFGVAVGHNSSESKEERKKAYVNNMVVFGEIGSFQRDLLLDSFYDEELGIGSRKKDFAIVDEVDSMLLDKGQNSLYLSHNIPGLDSLEGVYIQIWNFVHGSDMIDGPTAENIKAVRECMLDAIHGTMRKIDIINILADQETSERLGDVWRNLVDKGIIDDQGRILLRDKLLDNTVDLQDIGQINAHEQEALLCQLKDIVRKGIHTPVPKYLLEFVDTHLDSWIENAFRARWMVRDDHYVIDMDRSDATYNLAPNIVIMDKDTGVEQYHSQWNNGLHQFLQLKHGCRLSNESLKAVFMSNVSFFTQYDGRLYGLTGTLGALRERDLLKEMYGVAYATVPSFRASRLIEMVAEPCSSESEWIGKIVDTSHHISKKENRPVLIICESVHDVEILEKSFANSGTGGVKVHTYKRSFEPLDVGCESPIDSACIILATNLAGRGTDIKITKDVDESGGLHVCLTYLPSSYRVEEQAFGRAARKGQKGSGQMIYRAETDDLETHHDRFRAVIQDKVKRNLQEEQHIDQIKKHCESSIKKEEELFNKFQNEYQTLKSELKKGHVYDRRQELIILQSCLDNWAFLLDKYSMQSGKHSKEEIGQCGIEKFLAKMKKAGQANSSIHSIINSPAAQIKMAKELIYQKKYKEAEKMLALVISEDENFSEAAHYYKCYCIVKRSGGLNELKNKGDFIHHLHNALAMFQAKIEKLSEFAAIVLKIAERYKTGRASFLHANDFGKQKEDMIQLYSLFVRSIQDITGHEVSENALESCLNDPVLACYAFDVLQRENILTGAHIPISSGQDRKIQDRYQLFFREIDAVLKQNTNVTANTFRNILPNRQEFWELMIGAGKFVEEKEYVLLDTAALERTFITNGDLSKYKDEMRKMIGCDDFKHVISPGSKTEDKGCEKRQVKHIYLFPEQLDDIESGKLTAISSDTFKKKYPWPEFTKVLKEQGILKVNKICLFRKDRSTVARLKKYDSLDEDVFYDEIDGIDKKVSREIFHSLQENKIISNDGPHARLLVDDVTAESVNLTCHRNYETEILNVIEKHFRYRIALNTVIQEGQITLDSEPHEYLFNELVTMHVIEPVKVNERLTEDQVKEKILSLYDGSFSLSQLTEVCKIDKSIDVNELWKYLFDSKWIRSNKMNQMIKNEAAEILGRSGDICPYVDRTPLPPRFRSVECALKFHLACAYAMKEKRDILESQLQSWKSGLSKYDEADSELVDVAEQFDLEFKSRASEEFANLESNGLSHIITLCEEKWSFWAIFKMAAIAIIGLAQIALGVVIEVYTVGVGTHLAAGLIAEGMADIAFAIESAASGFCTWKAYAKHKVFSVAFTVLTCGVSAFFSRGAQFCKFGYKIGGDFLKKMAGKQLIKQVGCKRVIKEITKRVGKKMIEVTALSSADLGVEYVIKNVLDSKLRAFSNEVVGDLIDKIEHNTALRKSLQELCQKVGVQRAEFIVNQINKELYRNSSQWHEAITNIFTMAGAVSDGFNQASKKHDKMGNIGKDKAKLLAKVYTYTSWVLSIAQKIRVVTEFLTIWKNFQTQLEEKLNEVNLKTQQVPGLELNEKQSDEFCKKVTKQWEDYVVGFAQQKITELVQPIMKDMAHKLVGKLGKTIKTKYNKYQNSRHSKALLGLKTEKEKSLASAKNSENLEEHFEPVAQINNEYFTALVALQRKIRDPTLFAETIREGGPTGIYCIQAIADHLKRPVHIKTIGGDDTIIMPSEVLPNNDTGNGVKSKPIVLEFEVGDNSSFGHFKSPNTQNTDKTMMNYDHYDCLFSAVSAQTGQHISRDKVAGMVETNQLIKDRIKQGIHDHFLGKGAIGGVPRTDARQHMLGCRMDELRKKGTIHRKKGTKHKVSMRDKAAKDKRINNEGIAQSGTGNDELFRVSSLQKLHKKAMQQRKEQPDAPFDHLDCFKEIRVDTRYVIWLDKDGSIQGHTGALREARMEGDTAKRALYRTKGQKAFHDARDEGIHKESSAQQATVAALETHLKNMIHPDQLRNLDIRGPIYTSNGLDLSKKEKREQFTDGYEREYYKIKLVANKFNNDTENPGLPEHLKNDPYMERVCQVLEKTEPSDIKALGEILRDPAPETLPQCSGGGEL